MTNFVYDGLNPVQEKAGATVTANLLTGLGIDEFFQRTDGIGSRALLTDALGSAVALGDSTGTLQTQYTYEPFDYATQTGQASTNSYKHTGREDDGSGLYYYRARYYHSRLQRFISEDPIGFGSRDVNFYAYVGNNPIDLIDPLGLSHSFSDCFIRCAASHYGISGGLLRAIVGINAIPIPKRARAIIYLTNTYCSGSCPLDPAVVTQTMADGGTYHIDYVVVNQSVMQATITDPRGNKTVQRFNTRGHEIATVDAVVQQTRKTLDFTTNQVTEIRDPLNRLTKYTYDLSGNVNSILDPQGNPTIFEYESTFNRATRITDALNQQTRFTYDPTTGNLLTTTDPLLHATSITYNQFGQPISVTDALNHATTFEYDEVGNLIATVDPLGNRTLRFYDVVSRLIALIDPRGKSTQFTYDNLNRVTQIQDGINGITAFTYDPNGNLLTVTDAKNQVSTYTYDNMDRLATRKDALNRQETYQYDPAGNLTQFTDRKNQVNTFNYESLNRRIGASYADGSSTSFTYDAVGRLTKATDSIVGAIEFLYDNLDRLIKEVSVQGVMEYTYDALGRRTAMKANGATPVNYSYDAASRLIQVAQAGLVIGLGYDNANRRTSLTYPNGTNTSYAYDNASRLTNITHNGPAELIESLSYVNDAAGNRISLTRTNGAASNLPAAVQALYDAANEQITFNSLPATFDANANLTTSTDASGTTTYTWDARNRLVAQSGPGVSATYQYDALGRRINKAINGMTTQFLYDGKDIVQEIGGSAVGASYVRSLNIDEAFVRQMASEKEFYHMDALGNTRALSSAAGASTVNYSYEAFGKTTVTGASSNPFQYTGRENDGTGLYYYRARYFSAVSSRFLSEDPDLVPFTPLSVGLCRMTNQTIWTLPGRINGKQPSIPQQLNQYAYVRDNPLNFNDPSGLCDSGVNEGGTAGQIRQCRDTTVYSGAYNIPSNNPKHSGSTVSECIGVTMNSIGGDQGACKYRKYPNKKCAKEDVTEALKGCTGGNTQVLPGSCLSLSTCIDQDPNVSK